MHGFTLDLFHTLLASIGLTGAGVRIYPYFKPRVLRLSWRAVKW